MSKWFINVYFESATADEILLKPGTNTLLHIGPAATPHAYGCSVQQTQTQLTLPSFHKHLLTRKKTEANIIRTTRNFRANIYRVAPKNSICRIIKEVPINHIKSHKSLPIRLDYFIHLIKVSSAIINIKYSMCDLTSDINYCSWAMFVRYRSYNENDVNAFSCITSFFKLWISFVNHLSDANSCKNLFDVNLFSFSGS